MKSLVSCICVLFFLVPTITKAKEIKCRCDFQKPPWEAFGTKAACSAYTRKGKTSCEIEFGGLGYDSALLKNVLGIDPEKYRETVFNIVGTYIEAIKNNDKKILTNPDFIQVALPIFMRGAYLREPLDQLKDKQWEEELKTIDYGIASFFKNKSDNISKVFSGEVKSFKETYEGLNFDIGKGYVVVEYKDSKLVTIFIPND